MFQSRNFSLCHVGPQLHARVSRVVALLGAVLVGSLATGCAGVEPVGNVDSTEQVVGDGDSLGSTPGAGAPGNRTGSVNALDGASGQGKSGGARSTPTGDMSQPAAAPQLDSNGGTNSEPTPVPWNQKNKNDT